MNRSGRGSNLRYGINVTPLVDIVLVLLIIFIVLVPGMVRAAKVAMPSKDPGMPSESLVVSLEADGAWRLQTAKVTPGMLVEALSAAVQKQPMGFRKVFLKVHPDQPHSRVVEVLDAIRQAGQRAKQETKAKPEWLQQDGGDIRVVTGLLKDA